ncbi:MAG: type II toxin-antitoxin system HicA family toxin [Nitrospinae bacterium]|nr:type II toxin-antitoxin system HicA family toxin [Nitrospinota bacterium]
MKKRDVDRMLASLGYTLLKGGMRGGIHDKWVNANGKYPVSVPRHGEIGEGLAFRIIKSARSNKDK